MDDLKALAEMIVESWWRGITTALAVIFFGVMFITCPLWAGPWCVYTYVKANYR